MRYVPLRMDVSEAAPGLWRWTGLHPEWKQEVACTYVRTPDAIVLIDPLIPPEDTEKFIRNLDRDVGWVERPMHLFLTTFWHARSVAELSARYGAEVWAPATSVLPTHRRTGLRPHPVRPDDELPGGIAALRSGRRNEVVYYLPGHESLVAGDVLLGGPLRICPPGWIGKGGQEAVRHALGPLLDVPLKRVLVSHGQPVLEGGAAALRAALAA